MDTPQPFTRADADLSLLRGRTVAVLGYGNQGHAHALNLRDSGIDVIVGAREPGRGAERARADGFVPVTFSEAVRPAQVVMMLLPDEIQREVFERDVRPYWRNDALLAFGHGFALAFGLVELPAGRSAFLVAPKGQGHALRAAYRAGGGLPSLIGVEGEAPESTLAVALAYAEACGALAGGGFRSSFREEAITDQFGEQAVLCGGLVELIVAAWEILVRRGYAPEVAYFECLHETKIIVDLLYAHGIDGMRARISTTAAHGGLLAGPKVIGPASRQAMEGLLDDIERGDFARGFVQAQSDGGASLRAALAQAAGHPIVDTGRGLRTALDACRLESGGPVAGNGREGAA